MAAAGLAADVDRRLDDIDHGEWAGRSFAEVEASSPDALFRWLADPANGAPGGETMADLVARAGSLLEEAAAEGGTWLAVSHAMTIRAMLVRAIGLSAEAAFAIDIAPLSATVLSFNGRWRLQELRRA